VQLALRDLHVRPQHVRFTEGKPLWHAVYVYINIPRTPAQTHPDPQYVCLRLHAAACVLGGDLLQRGVELTLAVGQVEQLHGLRPRRELEDLHVAERLLLGVPHHAALHQAGEQGKGARALAGGPRAWFINCQTLIDRHQLPNIN
jgi:hypothetical protein